MKNKLLKKIILFSIGILVIFMLTGCTSGKILKYRDDGIEEYKKGNYEEALNLFESSLNIGKGRIGKVQYDLLLYKAECLIYLNRPYEARDVYEILLKVDKNNKTYNDLYNQINNSLCLLDFKNALNEDRVSDAIQIYEKIKELGLDHEKSVMYNRAVLYEKQGKWKDAYNAFLIYQKAYPEDVNCNKELDFIDNQSEEYIETKQAVVEKETTKNNKKKK